MCNFMGLSKFDANLLQIFGMHKILSKKFAHMQKKHYFCIENAKRKT